MISYLIFASTGGIHTLGRHLATPQPNSKFNSLKGSLTTEKNKYFTKLRPAKKKPDKPGWSSRLNFIPNSRRNEVTVKSAGFLCALIICRAPVVVLKEHIRHQVLHLAFIFYSFDGSFLFTERPLNSFDKGWNLRIHMVKAWIDITLKDYIIRVSDC